MNRRNASIAIVFAASAALGLSACSSSDDADTELQGTSAALENQVEDGRSTDSGSNSNEGDASALENSNSGGGSGSSDNSNSSNEGDASALEDHFANEGNEGDASALEDHFANEGNEGEEPESEGGEGGNGGAGGEGGNGGAGGLGGAQENQAEAESAVDNRGPKIVHINSRCNSGKLLTTWSLKDDSGVRTATVYRYNEYNAPIVSKAQWMGPETADGSYWAATSNGSQNLKDNVRIVATDKKGNSSEYTIQAPARC